MGDGELKGTLRPPSFEPPPAGSGTRQASPLGGQGGQGGGGGQPPPEPPGHGSSGQHQPPEGGGQASDGRSRNLGRSRAKAVSLAVVGVLLAGVLAFVVARSLTEKVSGRSVRLVAAGEAGAYPFTESVTRVAPREVEGFRRAVRETGSGAGAEPAAPEPRSSSGLVAAVSVEDTVVYGSRQEPVCDADALVSSLRADERLLDAWAGLVGVEPAEVDGFVAGLTPLVLGWDTAVTNSRYRAGEAERFQSVLEAGTAVLVDDRGVPRVQCSCGNPLAPSELSAGEEPRYEGDRWEDFEPGAVVTVEAASEPVSLLRTIDVVTRDPAEVSVGATWVLDGFLVDDDAGVYVVGEDGTRTQVLDHPVAAVFDDGAGGLVYQHSRPSGSWTTDVPGEPDQGIIWHLPAGSSDPVRLIESSSVSDGWVSLEDVGLWAGELAVAYLDLQAEEGGAVRRGALRTRSLTNGDSTTLIEDAWFMDDRDEMGGYSTSDVNLMDAFVTFNAGSFDHIWLTRFTPSGGEEDAGCWIDCAFSHDVTADGRVVVAEPGGQRLVIRVMPSGDVVQAVPLGLEAEWQDKYLRSRLRLSEDGLSAVLSFEDPAVAAVLVDLGSGQVQRVGLGGSATFLRAPIVRPAAIATAGDQPVSTTGGPPGETVVPSCLTDAEATDILQRTGQPESYREMSVQDARCVDGWADGTLVSGADGVGLVAFRRTDVGWEFAYGSGSVMTYCETARDAGAPAQLWADLGC